MNLEAVKINKTPLGVNRINNERSVSGLIISTPEIIGLQYNKVFELSGIKHAEDLGITSDFDRSENVNVYRHVSEFFRIAGEGTLLYLMLVPQTESFASIVEDTENNKSKRLLLEAKGKIRQLALALNPTFLEGDYLGGIFSDVISSIPKAQGLADWAYKNFMPCHIFLEGFSLDDSMNSLENLRDIPNVEAPKVSLVIGQDWNHADTKVGNAQKYADVGTILGVCSRAKINQNIGDNTAFNITDATRGVWLEAGLSNHKKNSEVHHYLQSMEDKGYIFGISYAGLAGIRINNDHCCTPIKIDSKGNINEHTIAYSRTLDDCIRQLRQVYLPRIKQTFSVDKDGKLPRGVQKYLELLGDEVFATMKNAGEISNGKTFVDPESDLIIAKELKISFNLQPTGCIGFINANIQLVDSFNTQ